MLNMLQITVHESINYKRRNVFLMVFHIKKNYRKENVDDKKQQERLKIQIFKSLSRIGGI